MAAKTTRGSLWIDGRLAGSFEEFYVQLAPRPHHFQSCPPVCLNPDHVGDDATVIDVEARPERKMLKP